jgi:hypothetical protein
MIILKLDFVMFYTINIWLFSNKPNPAAIDGTTNGMDGQVSGRACESCYGQYE